MFEDSNKKEFNSITFGRLTYAEMLFNMANFLSCENEKGYKIIIGTDSNARSNGKECTEYITALLAHKIGNGGIYFWKKVSDKKAHFLKERIYREALLSLEFAHSILGDLNRLNVMQFPLEIHVDVGTVGETRKIINEVTGMIRGDGFEVKTKPLSFGASKVADRHT
ncbi:MAG: ribonuclease H-like YkuK family protein [bacterium]